VALVVPNKERILSWVKENKLDIHQQETQKSILKLLESEIDKFRSNGIFAGQFPERWLPTTFAVLGESFTEQNKFLNSTLKMVRGKITEFYQNRIEYMFTAEGKDVCNHQNITIISRMREN
jgi:long-chain acyl-CoA synthetase